MPFALLRSFALLALVGLVPVLCSAAVPVNRLRALNFNLYQTPCPANNMTLQDLSGCGVDLNSLKGKVVLLNFWRIDCPPCRMEKPILERINRKCRDRGLEIVCVNLFDPAPRIRDYVNHGNYSFTFAHDPAGRLSLRQHRSAAGAPTNFVVNGRSEAIYEIRGVPTTYVIDRSGKIVGHQAGMINWEHPVFASFLESLLGPATVSTARTQPPPARTHVPEASLASTHSPSTERQGRPETLGREFDAPPPATEEPRIAAPTPRQKPEPRRLSFGAVKAPLAPPGAVEEQSASHIEAPTPTASRPAPKPQTRATVAQRQTENQKPARNRDRSQELSSRGRPARQPMRTAQASPPAREVGPALPPARPSARGVAPPPTTRSRSSVSATRPPSLPPLPAAMPYGDTAARRPTQTQPTSRPPASRDVIPLEPDDNGYVTARIPGAARAPQEQAGQAPQPVTPVRQQAQRTSGPNPIGGFIMEAFKPAPLSVERVGPPQRPTSARPAARRGDDSSLFGRIGDFVGGVKEAVSDFIPKQ